MKIVATCDIHYDLIRNWSEHDTFLKFIKSMEDERADVLILAGDTIGLETDKLESCLNYLQSVAPVRLMVFGNHEYWCTEGDTFAHLEIMKSRIEGYGFKLLDENPEIISGIGFAGNCAWYDYSLATGGLPPRSSYEKKIFGGHIIWNDVNFVRLGKADGEYANELLEKLEADIGMLENEVEQIIAVTHHVGFVDMLSYWKDFPGFNFCNAFMGSKGLGDMLLLHPKVKCHICGHTHDRKIVEKEHLLVLNPGSTYDEKKYISFVV
jgi:predicted phosphodiesterase